VFNISRNIQLIMERSITKKLLAWKSHQNRKPLILRGARQTGKTYSVVDFGKNCFEGTVHVVDLEKHPDWHRIFQKDLVTSNIVSELEILLNARIEPGKDLLFFDEIQSCPRAIMALRYFYEECPELHIIAAGSLLEFATKDISFPIGRVQFLNMFPMNFVEFLVASGKTAASEIIQSAPAKQPESIHNMILEELRKYLFVGGMPECVKEYTRTGHIRDSFETQSDLVNAYRQDFSKYAPYSDKRCLNAVFSNISKSVGQQIKYSSLADGYSNPTIKKAFDLLCFAQVIRKVPSASLAGIPLSVSSSERKFKALMIDVGLMQHLCGMPVDIEYRKDNLLAIYQGSMAEQFVGQEFLSSGQDDLYYWAREAKSSSAEVDFLIVKNDRIYPVEIKSGASGKLKSLHLLLQTYPKIPTGYVFSCAPYSELPGQKLIFIPIYYAFTVAANNNI
jgi:uncharacterized protein